MTSKQTMIGGVVAVVLTLAIGVAVGQRQAKEQSADALASMETETASLREKLQKTEADLAAMVRTAKQPKIKVTPTTPAPTAPPAAEPEVDERLAEKDEEIASLKEQIAQVEENRPQPRTREDWQQRMEQWQRDNPEEYQRMQEEREVRRQEMAQRTNDRVEFFASISTEGLSQEYLSNHEALLEKMQFFNDAMAQIAADPDGEASQQVRHDLRENMQGTREMLEMEREVLMSDMLSGLGADTQQTTEALDYMNYVNEMTSIGGFFRGGGGRSGGGGRGGR